MPSILDQLIDCRLQLLDARARGDHDGARDLTAQQDDLLDSLCGWVER